MLPSRVTIMSRTPPPEGIAHVWNVGRLDPNTGVIRLVTSPTPRSNPYGMVISSRDPYWRLAR